ncbi:glutaredoxin-C4-like [Prosopis cineraria]|uniref:glutaredoxin-C4-like n=1 Tax=Prosopis cineraria TaxID=364024 RepID=UPI0024103724|nr:glutaredoxin-C4-like [Prosopis cineraria]
MAETARMIATAMLVMMVVATSMYLAHTYSESDAGFVLNTISSHNIVIFSKSYCPHCRRAKAVFKQLKQTPYIVELDERDDGWKIQSKLGKIVGSHIVPQVFINGRHIGGSDETIVAYGTGQLARLLGIEPIDRSCRS